MEEEELHARMTQILEDLDAGKNKSAAFQMDEVLGYQINEEISGRIKNAKMKLDEGHKDQAVSMIERVVRLLDQSLNKGNHSTAPPISLGEINARLLYILDDLTNFKLKESRVKVNDLMKYELPEQVMTDVQIIKLKLDNYDDEEAEAITRELLEKIKKPLQ